MSRQSPLANVMIRAARRAGRDLIRDFGEIEQLQVSRRGPEGFTATALRKTRRLLHDELARARPGFALSMGGGDGGKSAGEGSGDGGTGDRPEHVWVVDPLGGDGNFLHGLPHFCISIGLTRNGEPVAGVVYDPLHDDLFWAERGFGAYRNSGRLRVSARKRLGEALIAVQMPPAGEAAGNLAKILGRAAGIRCSGAPGLDLAYVAAGILDGSCDASSRRWQTTAGVILVREAGGFATDFSGRRCTPDSPNVIAANESLQEKLAALLR